MTIPLALTAGDVAGVGPEVLFRALSHFPDEHFLIVGPEALMRAAAARFGGAPERCRWLDTGALDARHLFSGRAGAATGAAAHRAVTLAIELAQRREVAAVVTAPISKTAWKLAGKSDPGHTELIGRLTGRRTVMAFSGREADGHVLRLALATIHEPLASVPGALSAERLTELLVIVDGELRRAFRISDPRLGVAGLNPHAGEGGHIGGEEEAVIRPALAAAAQQGVRVEGPFPGDALFTPRLRRRFDLLVAMYHDQGLAPFKALTCNAGVNVTLGAGLVRTSPDHGTAFDLAGKGQAEAGSMIEAIALARQLAG